MSTDDTMQTSLDLPSQVGYAIKQNRRIGGLPPWWQWPSSWSSPWHSRLPLWKYFYQAIKA